MTEWLNLFFIAFFAALNGTYCVLMALALYDIIQRRATRLPEMDPMVLAETWSPPISILAPAYNEAATIVDSVRSFLQIEYPQLQVIVINDGSKDDTLERLQRNFDLKPIPLVVRNQIDAKAVRTIYQSGKDSRLLVVDKENGGKADALNVGLNVSRTPLVCCLDSDTVVDRRALLRMVEPFLYDERQVAAVGGTVRVANGCRVKDGLVQEVGLPRSWLARFQAVEYIRGFVFGRVGFNRIGGNLIISGAFGLFSRDALVEAGGYRHDTVGEDMEIIVRLHHGLRLAKRPYRIVHLPDPRSYTEVPESLRGLSRQRDRWQRGLADALMHHRVMFLNPRYGAVGMVVFPIFVFFELLGPVFELAGYGWFVVALVQGYTDPAVNVLFFLVAFFLGFLLSLQALVMDELEGGFYQTVRQRAVLVLFALVENFGYRQLTLFFRLRGMWKYFTGDKSWGSMVRKGFAG